MQQYSFLIKPASSLCNMRCHYCFYADVSAHRTVQSFGMMQEETMCALLNNIFQGVQSGDSITFAFQGGEPTLAGLPYFKKFVRQVEQLQQAQQLRVHVHYALQTNGLAVDKDWVAFFAAYHFLLGLSLDGDAALHDENRLDTHGKGTHRRVLETMRLLEAHGVEYNILWVLTNKCARSPQKVWNFLCANDIRFVQLIPCLADLDHSHCAYALTPQRFASFYTALFPLWATALTRGEYRSVKLFDDVCNLLGRGVKTACGITGQCQNQYVIEADGSVYPCDFFVLDAWKIGSLALQPLQEIQKASRAQEFMQRTRVHNTQCDRCEFWHLCGGGCPRMHTNVCFGADLAFCGYRQFLRQCGTYLQQIGKRSAQLQQKYFSDIDQ